MKPVTPFDNYPSFGNAGARQAPGDAKYALGFVAADTFPAEWANYFFHGATKGVSDLNTAVRSIWVELGNILSSFGITADASAESQLLTALRLNSTFIKATNNVVTGPLLVPGGTIRILFTQAISGENTTTGMTISYNGQSIPVRVYKDGILQDFTASKVSWMDTVASYKYLDAGTTFVLLYDTTQFIIVNNPVVLQSVRYTIYADGTVDGGNIATIKPSFTETLDYGWLACEHQSLPRADYPKLLSYFQTHKIGNDTMLDVFGYEDADHFYLPDTREAALVGAGKNLSDSIATHDEYTVGQFKDDRLQSHSHFYYRGYNRATNNTGGFAVEGYDNENPNDTFTQSGRYGNTTRGKRKGVKYIIKVL